MKRHDEEQMLSFYQQWLDSGQSKAYFANTQGINPSVFYYWVKKFQGQEPGALFSADLTGFRQISLDRSPAKAVDRPLARICYPSGVSIELYELPDAALLKSLAG